MNRLGRICALTLLGAAGLLAQATASATLQGTVTDKSGAVIPNAAVKISSPSTGLAREGTTNQTGLYRFDLLPAGMYTLRVTAAGFAAATYEKLELAVGATTTIDPSLNPSSQAETITVEATGAPLVDTAKTDVSLAIRPQDVVNLPLNGRDFVNLAYLAPGAKPVDSYDPTKNRMGIFAINGSSGRNVNVTVNGVDNKDNTIGGPVMQFPLEAIQEFNISTQRFSAANGRSEGGAVNVITKSGSNQFHGSAFYFGRAKELNALNYFEKRENGGTGQKGPFRRDLFGGSIGGPLIKDKTFLFFAIERQREDTSTVADGNAVRELTLVQNLGAKPASVFPTPYRDWRYNGRLDHRFNEKHNMFLTYSNQNNRGENDQITPTSDLTGGNFTTNQLILANATFNSVLTPNVVNAFTSGYQYWHNLIDTPALSPTFFFTVAPNAPTFGTNVNVPQESGQAKWQFRDDLSIVKGKHALRVGMDLVYQPKLGGFFKNNPTLTMTFQDLPSKILSDRATYPQGFATPGAVLTMQATSGDPYFYLKGGAKMFGTYFQDDWKMTRRLTVNLGIRWDKDFNLVGNEALARSRTMLALQAIRSPFGGLAQNYGKAFSPRFGFGYDVTGNGRHVIRGGYGIYFGQTFLNIPLFMLQQANDTVFGTVLDLTSSGPGDTAASIVNGTNIRLSAWRFGVDPMPVIPPAATRLADGARGRAIDPHYAPPYNQQWNIGYAFQLNPNNVVEVEYVHTLGLRESKTFTINERRPGVATRTLEAQLRAAGQPVLGRIEVEQSVGRSRYDGLNVSYRRRLTNHFSVNTNYVLSKAVAYFGNAAAFRNRPTDLDNIFAKYDLGPTPNDERHRWVVSGIVDLPWKIRLAPVMQWASARPYEATQGIDALGFGGGQANPHAILKKSDPENYTATAAFTAAQLRAGLADGSLFISNYNSRRGAMFYQLDLRATKNVKIRERANVELFFQAFNLTNRANFGNTFQGNIRSATFGQPTNFLTPNGAILPRSFSGEFGARFSF